MKKVIIALVVGGLVTGVYGRMGHDFEEVSLDVPTDSRTKTVTDKVSRNLYNDSSFAKKVLKQEVGKQVGINSWAKQAINGPTNITELEEVIIQKVIEKVVPYILAIVFKELPKMVAKAFSNASSSAVNKVKSGFNWLTGRNQAPEEVLVEQPIIEDELFVRNY